MSETPEKKTSSRAAAKKAIAKKQASKKAESAAKKTAQLVVLVDDLAMWAAGFNAPAGEKYSHKNDPSCLICRPNAVHDLVLAQCSRIDELESELAAVKAAAAGEGGDDS